MQLGESRLAHDAAPHHTACYAHDAAVLRCGGLAYVVALLVFAYDGQVDEAFYYLCAESVSGVFCCRVWLYAHAAQLLKRLTSDNLLF